MNAHHTLHTELNNSLERIEMTPVIFEEFKGILERPRALYLIGSEYINFSRGDLFVTLEPADLQKMQDQKNNNLRQGCGRSRKDSLVALERLFANYVADGQHSVILCNGISRTKNLAEHPHNYLALCIEDEIIYCLDRQEQYEGEIFDFAFTGMSGYYSIGMLTSHAVHQQESESVDFDTLVEAVVKADAFIFSVCDCEAFAIWYPTT